MLPGAAAYEDAGLDAAMGTVMESEVDMVMVPAGETALGLVAGEEKVMHVDGAGDRHDCA